MSIRKDKVKGKSDEAFRSFNVQPTQLTVPNIEPGINLVVVNYSTERVFVAEDAGTITVQVGGPEPQ